MGENMSKCFIDKKPCVASCCPIAVKKKGEYMCSVALHLMYGILEPGAVINKCKESDNAKE